VRKSHSNGADTYRAIRAAAVDLIYRYGYNGTSMRRLAAEVGIDQSTLYYHIKSKQNLLYQINTDVRDQYLADLHEALSVDDPVDQLRRFIRYHVGFRFKLRKMSFIAASELRFLAQAKRKKVIDTQRVVLDSIKDIINAGITAQVFDVPDSTVAALAIIQLLNGINSWYSPSGRLSEEQVIEMNTQFVLGLLRSGNLEERASRSIHADGSLN
jgi:AcrR family transcriptional regulator